MSKRKFIAFFGVIGILANILIFNLTKLNISDKLIFSMNITSDQAQVYQIFYSEDGTFAEERSAFNQNSDIDDSLKNFEIPGNTNYIRIDFGNQPGEHIIHEMYFTCNNKKMTLDNNVIINNDSINMMYSSVHDGNLLVTSTGEDPFCIINVDEMGIKDFINQSHTTRIIIYKIIICLIVDCILALMIRYSILIKVLLVEILRNRKLIFTLAKNDFKTKYAGSYLGIIWAFVQPITTILVYWFVFQVGFRSGSVNNYPFVLWFIAGLIPWFFFSDAIIGGTNSFIEYSYLVKKVVFKISILPIVKILSAFFIHAFFVVFLVITYLINGYKPDLYSFQVIYYSVCMLILSLGISYATSSIVVFFKDLGQIVNIVLQIGIWITPIMWNYTMIPEKYRWIFKINPMYYVIEGYRNSMIYKVWFWEDINYFIFFWGITIVLFLIGSVIFKRLKAHFADVL